ncbi:MAG TPA: PfkB family carbohydrate kinase [Luteitalea sp.]|nr:PfkB family carbohydrate kinase [Luteitalea sp.]
MPLTPARPVHDLAPVVEAFRRQHVLVIGDLMLDEYIDGSCDRVSPEAPVPVVQVHGARLRLGGAGNTAANVATLGGRCTLAGRLGRDEAGSAIRRLAGEFGVTLRAADDLPSTTRKVRIVGERQQVVRLDYESEAPVESTLAADARAALEGVDVVVVSDYARGAITPDVYAAVLAQARATGVPVIVDPRPQHRDLYRGCTYITPNWKEALALLGEAPVAYTPERALHVATMLAERFETTAILTLGGRGVLVAPRDGSAAFQVSAAAREVFDVSGAGDTVVAALALAIAAGADLVDAVHVATRAAGLVVGKLGTATVSADELLADASGRLIARQELAAVGQRARAAGQSVVSINGSFDLLHAGHLTILEAARAQGDVLVVGLNSDSSVRGYKGPHRPIVSQADRARLLLALRVVDFVHVFDEADPIAFLEALRPDVHVNGAEYGEHCIEAPAVAAMGARLHLVPRVPGLSTSDLARRLANPRQDDAGRP